jgi:hypothetical protein
MSQKISSIDTAMKASQKTALVELEKTNCPHDKIHHCG